MPTKCNRGFYCRSYCLLNMFRAPLCPSSGAQEYYTVVAARGISCCKDVKSHFVSRLQFVFSTLSVVCYLGLLLGVSNKTSVASSWQLLLSLYLLLFFFLFSKSCPFWTLLLFEFSVLTSEIFLCFLLVHPSKLFVHCGRLSM